MPSYDQNPPIFFDSGLTYNADPVPTPALRRTKINKVRRNWASQSPTDCIASAKTIVECCAANADIPVPNARLYQLQTSTNPTDATLWKEYGVPQSRSSLVLSGLQSGVKIWVRVRALGAGEHPAGPWSDPAVRSVP